MATPLTTTDTPWDETTQQFHGGQDWASLANFVEDFSVTTNALGTPKRALEAAKTAIDLCGHYPPANQEPAKSNLARFLWPQGWQHHRDRLLLGNGASELIDLVVRSAPEGPWKPGPFDTQYKEYERSARNGGRTLMAADAQEPAALACIVNPCNPTGDYKSVADMKAWIGANVQTGGYAIIDESMQPWLSFNFRADSMTSQADYVQQLFTERGISVFVIHSWTKLWSCTGIRLGSIVCPTAQHCQALKAAQVPWSVNCAALAFLSQVVKDDQYMADTWALTPTWRKHIIATLSQQLPQWLCYGEPFLSWVWIDTGSEDVAQKAVALARGAGVPVRNGLPGYSRPTFVRVAVREPSKFAVLLDAWRDL